MIGIIKEIFEKVLIRQRSLNNRGIALIATYIVVTVILASAGPFFWRTYNEFRFAQRQRDETKAYYATEAALAQVAMEIYQEFNSPADSSASRPTRAEDKWQEGDDEYQAEFRDILDSFSFPINGGIDDLTYTVALPARANRQFVPTDDGLLLRLVAAATAPHLGGEVRKIVASNVSYEMKPSPVFNYGYFINNSGRLDGRRIVVNGDIRANGDFSFNDRPRVNGEIYAAENPDLGTAGTVSGDTRDWDIAQYQNNAPIRARPTNPTGPPNPGGEIYDAGYDGESNRYEHQRVLDMPYLGDLEAYERLANSEKGRITQDGTVLVNRVYEGRGPDGINNTPDDGCIVLIGTDARPIVIDGPVVIEKDLVIKGVISGQGAIYAGRNIHILGNITYKDPPSWPKPDEDPDTTAKANKTKDFVGFAAKGNVVIGDYTEWGGDYRRYLRPPATQGYEIVAADVALGYDSDPDDARLWFDGDYTANDGGYKIGEGGGGGRRRRDRGGDTAERRFYESSLSDSFIHGNADGRNDITQIDGIFYNNHALAGRIGNCSFNGSVASRDEALAFRSRLSTNYDVRANRRSIDYIDIYLPRSLVLPETRARQSG